MEEHLMTDIERTVLKDEKESSLDTLFPIIRASTLTIDDPVLQYQPPILHRRLKDSVVKGILEGIDDFRYPIIDPWLDENDELVYQMGKWPAVYKSAKFWDEKFQNFMPEKNSRMATSLQRDVFLIFLIKYLVKEEGYTVAQAWKAVNWDSKKMGHYTNSEDAKCFFEKTGSRPVWKFYDLANTAKIVKYDKSESGYGIMGGSFKEPSGNYPLSTIRQVYNSNYEYDYSTGAIVMDP